MAEKKEKPEAKDEQDVPVEMVSTAENVQQAEADLEMLKKRVEEAEAKAAENLDGWQRSHAEFLNYKNRIQRDQEAQRMAMKGDILRRVLPVMDDLERALANRPAGDPWADGLDLILRKFQSILEAEGLTRIEAEGRPFDPNFHEAISHEPANGVESGHVIAVVQNGYLLGERVVRPAVVRVAQ